jgi:beta-phosphoglucomutase-like phosphatase (HAD superfamily)
MLRAVIFDMDGVLVDSEPYHHQAETRIFADLGISVPDEERRTFVGMSGRKMWEIIRERHAPRLSVEELLSFDRGQRLSFFSTIGTIRPIPGVTRLLGDLRAHNMKIGLASSSIMDLIRLITGAAGIGNYFDILVSGEEVEHGKPAPDIFMRAAMLLGVGTRECVVIEDSENGVRAAKAAGIACVGFNNPGFRSQDLSMADLVVDDFARLDYAALSGVLE